MYIFALDSKAMDGVTCAVVMVKDEWEETGVLSDETPEELYDIMEEMEFFEEMDGMFSSEVVTGHDDIRIALEAAGMEYSDELQGFIDSTY